MDSKKSKIFQFTRELRKKHDITQADLAVMAGISLPALQRFEAGNETTRMDTVNKILVALGCELIVQIKASSSEATNDR